MITRSLFIVAIAVACSLVQAQELYGTNNTSIRESATPGEYYFNTAAAAVKANDYLHAVTMYKVSASWAYKPAEYNLGVIFAKGEGGVPIDLPQAYAWMTLAAERGDRHYTSARDRVKSALGDDALKQSEVLLADMRKIYGDEVALARAKTKWREVLSGVTGSHVGFTGNNMKVGNATNFRGNPTTAKKTEVNDSRGRGAVTGVSGINSAADVIGGSGVDGSIAYHDLRATDNPYDPRFAAGVVTVGEINSIDPKKPEATDGISSEKQ